MSIRKVKAITEKLCGTHFSKALVSSVCQQLDTETRTWLQRPLTQPYRYLVVDASYEHVRETHRVVSKGGVLVQGVGQDGHRDLLTVAIAPTESQATWGQLFSGLIDRGLTRVRLVTSDEHKRPVQAIRRYFDQASWQCCQVHFQRTMLAEVPKTHRTQVASQLRGFLKAVDRPQADRLSDALVQSYESSHPPLVHKLETHREALLACLAFPLSHRPRLRTTNAVERLHREIARRSDVVQIFPNEQACLRLVAALGMEWAEEWTNGKRYLDPQLSNQ